MGLCAAKGDLVKGLQQNQLIIGTLNYCSIMSSPFEFYSHGFQKQLQEISNIFESLIPQYIPNYNKDTFKWNLGKVDVKMRIGRYAPFFSLNTGIQNSRFVTKQRFSEIWDQVVLDLTHVHKNQFTHQHLQNTKIYDLIAYHSLLTFVYKHKNFDQLIKENPAKYIRTFKPFFQQSFLDQKKKLKQVIQNFKNINFDILFVQEYSSLFQEYIDSNKQYIKITDKSKDTMIIAKRASFVSIQNTDNVLSKTQIERLNWAGKTSILCVDNLILVNVHLHSNTEKNKVEIQQLKRQILRLRRQLPKYDIVIGGDLNSFLAPTQSLNSQFNMFPKQQGQITTSKKRTMAQAQYHKGNKLILESKDKIITSLKLKNCQILHIDGKEPKAGYMLPSNDHPFDHYLLLATIYK